MIRLFHSLANSIGDAWCQLMHPDPMWPVKGKYICPTCQRQFPVKWEQPAEAPELAPAKREAISSATVHQAT